MRIGKSKFLEFCTNVALLINVDDTSLPITDNMQTYINFRVTSVNLKSFTHVPQDVSNLIRCFANDHPIIYEQCDEQTGILSAKVQATIRSCSCKVKFS